MDGHSYVVIWTLEISKKRIFCGWIVRLQWPKKGLFVRYFVDGLSGCNGQKKGLFVRMRGAKEEYREVRGEGRGFKTT